MIHSWVLLGAVAAFVAGASALRPASQYADAKPPPCGGFRDPLAHRLDRHWRAGYYVG